MFTIGLIAAVYAKNARQAVIAFLDQNLKLNFDGKAFTINDNNGKELYQLLGPPLQPKMEVIKEISRTILSGAQGRFRYRPNPA